MRRQIRKFKFKKMAIALAFILCNCFLINAMAEPYSQAKVNATGKSTTNEIQREKSVKSVGDDEYEISLKVWGTERTTVTPVDIVMVMDTSGSMSGDIRTLRSAMNTFIDDINKGVKESRISVVKFAGPTSFRENGKTENAQVIAGFNTSIQTKKDKINATRANGGTNAEAAWDRVKEQMDQSKKDRPNANRYVLFFTDGLPTVINGKRPVEETKHDYIRNTIIPATMKKYEAAIGNGVKSYAIGLLDNVGTNGRELAKEFLNKVNNQKAYFIENQNINLGEIYKDIANNIIKDATIAKDAVLTDVVTDQFEIVTDENGSDITSEVYKLNSDGSKGEKLSIKGTINKETGTISWKLGEVGAAGMLVTFRIRLKDDYYGTGNVEIPTNKEANMIYTDPVTNKEGEKIEFNKPEISISFKTGSITIEKVVENNEGLAAPADDTFSISLDGGDIGELNVNLKDKEPAKRMDFYLKGKNTDISNNTDISKNYINAGTYNIKELVPMNYELEGIYVYNSKSGVYGKSNTFTINKKNKDIKIKVKNKYVNDKYFYDKAEKENVLQLAK